MLYQNLDFLFTVEDVPVRVLTLALERFVHKVPKHSHGPGCYEMHYIASGSGKIMVDGVFYQTAPGTVYLTGPYTEHSEISTPQNPMCEYCIYFKLDTGTACGSAFVNSFLKLRSWVGQDCRQILPLLKELSLEMKERLPGYEEQMTALLKQIFISLIRNFSQKSPLVKPARPRCLAQQKSVIAEDYFLYEYKHLSLEELSSRLGLSPRQTERFLKDYYGKTFLQKRTEARMSSAALLLSDSRMSVTAVAEELGYSSVEHFSNAFKRYYGINAREFRKKQLHFSEILV